MSKYRVYGMMTASKFLGEFEADSEDDALLEALREVVAYCEEHGHSWSALSVAKAALAAAQGEGK